MRSLLLAFSMVPLSLALLAAAASGQEEDAPQHDWMVHVDRSTGEWRFLPDRLVLVPVGTIQLMVFGEGQFSLTLDDASRDADIATTEGTIRTAEFAAPTVPGEYPFHDKYHPEARGTLIVREPSSASGAQPSDAALPVIGVVSGGYESAFAPSRIEVDAGAEVRFTANGTFGHNLQAVDGTFTASDLAPGSSSTFRAPEAPGEYAFECRFHKGQGMIGTLVVRSATAPSPASDQRGTAGLTLGMGLLTVGLCALVAAQRPRRGDRE